MDNLPPFQLSDDFGDPETLFNSRDWLKGVLEARGAKVTGGSVGGGSAELDVLLEGHKFIVRIWPI